MPIFLQEKQITEDATLFLNNTIVEHLEKKNTCTCVRSLFIDFSSVFNTLKPDIIITILKSLEVSPILCKFILDFLINRKQQVCINDILSDMLLINRGSPQRLCTLCCTIHNIYQC